MVNIRDESKIELHTSENPTAKMCGIFLFNVLRLKGGRFSTR